MELRYLCKSKHVLEVKVGMEENQFHGSLKVKHTVTKGPRNCTPRYKTRRTEGKGSTQVCTEATQPHLQPEGGSDQVPINGRAERHVAYPHSGSPLSLAGNEALIHATTWQISRSLLSNEAVATQSFQLLGRLRQEEITSSRPASATK